MGVVAFTRILSASTAEWVGSWLNFMAASVNAGKGSQLTGLSKTVLIKIATVAISEAITSAAPTPAKVNSAFATIRISAQKPRSTIAQIKDRRIPALNITPISTKSEDAVILIPAAMMATTLGLSKILRINLVPFADR